MNAGRLLRQAGFDTDELRVHIAPLNPDTINVWPASAVMRRFWRSGVKGVTHWKWVFVDPQMIYGDRDRLARLVVHELVHVRQYQDAGYLAFTARYLYEYWKGRRQGKDPRQAYLDIEAEQEARRVAAQVTSVI